MPSGENPKSKENLKLGNRFNKENAREMQKKAVEKKTVIKTFSEYLQQQLGEEMQNGKITKENLSKVLLKQLSSGNMKAWELVLKLIGEYPAENITAKISVDEDYDKAIKELKKMMLDEG